MRFEILNVEHGFAAYAQANDGSVLLFDCGHSATCRPSEYLPAQGVESIQQLFITNYDEDHIADLPELYRRLPIEVLRRNDSMTSADVRKLKSPPISSAMRLLLDMIDNYTGDVTGKQLEPNGIRVWTYCNYYPSFVDTNNLSLLSGMSRGMLKKGLRRCPP